MLTGWRYRIVSVAGVGALVVSSLLIANHPAIQQLFTTYVPLFNRLEPTSIDILSLWWAMMLSIIVIGGSLLPLYRPRPSRLLDTVLYAQKRIIVGGLGLAAFGYFQWSHRLPRATLTMTVGLLVLTVPIWFVWIRRRPTAEAGRTLLVGDDLEQIERISLTLDSEVVGCLSPAVTPERTTMADGGLSMVDSPQESSGRDTVATDPIDGHGGLESLSRLGGLSRLNDVLVEQDIDTVVLAFRQADRGDFFGALDVCHDHGVNAKVHREYADSVLVSEGAVGDLVAVDLEPWDPLDHLFKRAFDIVFAVSALLVLTPVILAISIAIKLDDGGSILYCQERTAVLGESFPVYKFRSMIENAEEATGAKISEEDSGDVDPRVTRVGHVLRKTHLDEIPQLWAILTGSMSVVGPRPERPELDTEIQSDGVDWSKRWFVKPGLTGLAQINDVTGYEPGMKLRYDLEYVRQQSFWFDVKIVIRQIWKVLNDVREFSSDE
jgi:lipopolysaccharide/colanic/teichoic acid biosynthesis glycosyltransferase